MPRKQRFKPSRKPKTEGMVPSQQVDDRKDAAPEQQEIGSQAPVRNEVRDIESDRD